MELLSFTSMPFIIIVGITFLLYWNLQGDWRNIILTVGCFSFYLLGGLAMAGIFLAMTLFTYFLGNAIIKESDNKRARLYLCLGIVLNIGILVVFKYLNFFISNFAMILNSLGLKANVTTLRLIMPVGLSFYTFMLTSHLIDCKRNVFEGKSINVFSFLAYVSFFPHLIAGPIDRSRLLLPQIDSGDKFSFVLAREGLWQILNGLIKKLLIADMCAIAVDTVWADLESYDSLTLILTSVLYSMQIYFDFSAFSDMAIGVGKLFGLKLMRNFNYPYFSRNVSEFWRKWHMSLTSWFTEYVYIPLGGNRRGLLRTIINTIIVFGLCGIWHGANWGYAFWGILCGMMFIPYLLQKRPAKCKDIPTLSISNLIKIIITFTSITLVWIIFRGAQSTPSMTLRYFSKLFEGSLEYQVVPYMLRGLMLSAIFILFEWIQRRKEFALLCLGSMPQTLRWIVYIGIIILLYFAVPIEQSTDPFIYQNF